MLLKFILSILCFIIGAQISINEIKLTIGKFNYRKSNTNLTSLVALLISYIFIYMDFHINSLFSYFFNLIIMAFLYSIIKEWLLAKINCQNLKLSLLLQFISIGLSFFALQQLGINSFIFFLIAGFYFRNCPFGVVHGKVLFIQFHRKNTIWKQKIKEIYYPIHLDKIADFSKSGCSKINEKGLLRFDVSLYKIFDSKEKSMEKLQSLLNKVGKSGGGIIYFPKGKYYFNTNRSEHSFLQINYSNIIFEGETDKDGNPLAELVNCSHTLCGDKNPWLSPFFITTGEALQKSNIFWGIQFKKKKKIITRSGSLADPGSDGTILTPKYAARVVVESRKRERLLRVDNTSTLNGIKYLMLAMYNTTADGNLIKDILATNKIRKEWGTALRAGEEEAPSYQDLLEIEKIVDQHTVLLTQPLRRDCLLEYKPEIYTVEMLENITIRNLKLNSKWNGLFRHHGFPIYYSIRQSQEMDYGWNGINMKRVAHGKIENIIFENFTNPLYVMDSRNITVEHIVFRGYDGHQGIKVYEHACDNLFKDIKFYNHFADMMGGEGNAYGNVFTDVSYRNPCFKPVDFDFHGFSEGPMSPPAYNLFENIRGFRAIKAAGALYNQPACAQQNIWWNIQSEGEKYDDNLFISLPYMPKKGIWKKISALRHSVIKAIQNKQINISIIKCHYKKRIKEMNETGINPEYHHLLFPYSLIVGYITKSTVKSHPEQTVRIEQSEHFAHPLSLYQYQLNHQK